MEPTTPNKGGRPKKGKSFRGITPKQKTTPNYTLDTENVDIEKSPQNVTHEIPSSIVSVNANTLNDANRRIPFLPVNEIWQRQMCQFFKIDLHNILQVSSAEIAGAPSLTRTIRGDGNCFYRAVSYLISGTEGNHNIIRGFLLQHMLKIQ